MSICHDEMLEEAEEKSIEVDINKTIGPKWEALLQRMVENEQNSLFNE